MSRNDPVEKRLDKKLTQASAALRAARLRNRPADIIRRLEKAEERALDAWSDYLHSQGRG